MDELTATDLRGLTVRLAAPYVLCVALFGGGAAVLSIHAGIAVACFVLGGFIALNLWIGRSRSDQPLIGENVDRESQAALWRLVSDSAEQAGSKMPKW